jgi:CMP/dCMP kinase
MAQLAHGSFRISLQYKDFRVYSKACHNCGISVYLIPLRKWHLISRKLVIAIDGPAASGKSTTARLVAERLGYLHVDTGAMYRAVALKVVRQNIPTDQKALIEALVAMTHVALQLQGNTLRVNLDGEDVTEAIRTPEISKAVSPVSTYPEVRRAMVREQRLLGANGGIVMDGRDIGTVVFPDADLKFFMVAGLEARARRRQEELAAKGTILPLDAVLEEIRERDARDAGRAEAPLRRADDAIDVDTSAMTIDEQVGFVLDTVSRKLQESTN